LIDFSLTEEQEALRDLVREFASGEIVPLAPTLDEEQRHSPEIVEKYFEIGFLHYAIPEEYGGAGLGTLDGCLFSEELGAACGGIACVLGGNTLGLTPLFIAGSHELKGELLPPHTEGPKLAAFCLTEDSVFAMENPEMGNKGFSAFMVPTDTPGITIGKKENKMGQRTADTREVTFQEVRIPARYRLGKGFDGFKIAMMTLDESRATVGAAAVGIARAALEVATEYAKERVQFGKPLAGHQAIQFKLADTAMKVNAGRLLCWQAAWLNDNGHRNTTESAMAKCFTGDMAMEVTTEAVQILGGYGYMKDYPVEKYMRDAKLHQIYEGTNEIQRIVIARGLLT